MTTNKKIVILGGSYGGVSTAHYLLRHVVPRLSKGEGYQVVMVSPSAQVMCRPACPRALLSDDMFPQQKLFVDIPVVFQQYPKSQFTFIQGSAVNLDDTSRSITVRLANAETDSITYHALVIATGASTPSPLFGFNQGDDKTLKSSWHDFREALPKAKTIVIGGGGPVGIETAGELGEFLNGRPGWFGSNSGKQRVNITVVTAGSHVLPALRPALAKQAEGYLRRLGVTVIKGTRVKSVALSKDGNFFDKADLTLDDGTTMQADIYIPATGLTPNTHFIRKELLEDDGRVKTNVSTLRVDAAGPRVYAVGDVASCARPAIHNVLNAVPILCGNILHDLSPDSKPAEREFKEDTRETQLVPVGRSKGVGAAMGYRLPSFLVWLMKGRDYWLWTTGDLWSGKHWKKTP